MTLQKEVNRREWRTGDQSPVVDSLMRGENRSLITGLTHSACKWGQNRSPWLRMTLRAHWISHVPHSSLLPWWSAIPETHTCQQASAFTRPGKEHDRLITDPWAQGWGHSRWQSRLCHFTEVDFSKNDSPYSFSFLICERGIIVALWLPYSEV